MDSLLPFGAAVSVRSRGYLPHWEIDHGIDFITYRLADSLPAAVTETLRRELEAIRKLVGDRTAVQRREIRARFFRLLDEHLDAGFGECSLRQDAVASIVVQGWQRFDGERYRLISWCVMPNHVHVVVELFRGADLAQVIKAWKGAAAREANRLLSRSGRFWWRENPLKIGLRNWPYVGVAG